MYTFFFLFLVFCVSVFFSSVFSFLCFWLFSFRSCLWDPSRSSCTALLHTSSWLCGIPQAYHTVFSHPPSLVDFHFVFSSWHPFILALLFPKNKFLEMELMSWRVCIIFILKDIARLLSRNNKKRLQHFKFHLPYILVVFPSTFPNARELRNKWKIYTKLITRDYPSAIFGDIDTLGRGFFSFRLK